MLHVLRTSPKDRPEIHACLFLLLAGCLASVPLARAQNTDATPATVVTVTAQAMPLSSVPASVTILTRDYIESSHANNAADLLRSTPFLQVGQAGASGGFTTVNIRGSKASFTVVMIDGIPVNDITNLLGGAFDFSSLAVDNIEQVEIVRGPLSSVYGSDAIGGVINFISRKGSKKSLLDLSGELGSFLRRQFKASTAGTWKALQYSASASRLDVDEQVLDDGYSESALALSGSIALGKNAVLDFTTRWMDDRSAGFPTGSGGPEFALSRQPQSDYAKELILGTSLKGQVHPWWTYTVDLDRVNRKDENNTPAVLDKLPPSFRSLPPSTSNSDFTRTRFGATTRFALRRDLTFGLSAAVLREDGNLAGFLAVTLPQSFQLTRTTFLGGSSLEYSNSRLTAIAGISFDKTEGFGEVTSPRLGLNWLSAEHGPRFRTSWAKGFKLPSFYAYGNPLVGNKSLRPERGNSFDVGVEQVIEPAHVTLSGTWFRNNFHDLVDFDSATFHLVNRSQALIRGFEFGAEYAPGGKVRFGLDFSYLTWKIQPAVQPFRDIPHGNGGVHLEWKPSERFRARVETQWMGRRYDFQTPVPNQTSTGGYSNSNFSASYDLDPKFTFFVRADNFLDSHYHEYIGFPSPGAAVRAGVQFHARPK